MKTIIRRLKGLAHIAIFGLHALSAQAAEQAPNVLNCSELIPSELQRNFTQKFKTRLTYDILDSDDALEGKLLTGNSGYDVVYPSSSYMTKQIKAGAYLPLDWSKIPSRVHLDPRLLEKLNMHDPDNRHGVPFIWGTNGILINVEKVQAILSKDADLSSHALLFDPQVVSKLAKCGVPFLDSPQDVFTMVLAYLGRDPNSNKVEDYQAAFAQLQQVWPHIKQINSTYRDQITRGDICAAMAWSGDAGVINRIVRENQLEMQFRYMTPRGQAPIWFTIMGIPADAKNTEAAYQWINYLLEPTVATQVSEYNSYPSAVSEAQAVGRAIKDSRYAPEDEEIASFYISGTIEPKTVSVMTQYWRRLYSD